MVSSIPRFDRGALHGAIREKYGVVATEPACGFHFIHGRPLAERLGYDEELVRFVPDGAIDSFAGVGNPFAIGRLAKGEVVLDIGCGAGIDSLIAARQVGAEGKVVGIDLTERMVERAGEHARQMGVEHARFEVGYAESLPFADESFDVVISNGVINLCPDKQEVFAEIHRVLKPGGRIQIADVLLRDPIPGTTADLMHLWTDCVAGGILDEEYLAILGEVGFRQASVISAYDVFRDARIERSARQFGARGCNVLARK